MANYVLLSIHVAHADVLICQYTHTHPTCPINFTCLFMPTWPLTLDPILHLFYNIYFIPYMLMHTISAAYDIMHIHTAPKVFIHLGICVT